MHKVIKLNNEQQKLVEENHNLIYSYLRQNNLSIEDYYDLAAIGLCLAAYSYKPEVSKFSTYAYIRMKGIVIKHIARTFQKKTRIPDNMITSLNENVIYNNSLSDNKDNERIEYIIDTKNSNFPNEVILNEQIQSYLKTVDSKTRKVIELMSHGLTQKEIGEIVGLSQPQISREKIKFLKYLGLYKATKNKRKGEK